MRNQILLEKSTDSNHSGPGSAYHNSSGCPSLVLGLLESGLPYNSATYLPLSPTGKPRPVHHDWVPRFTRLSGCPFITKTDY